MPPPGDFGKDVFKLEAERRLREISKHREMGVEGMEVHSNLHRCLEELRCGFQEKAHNRRNNLARRNALNQARRKQFDHLRDLQRAEEGVRTPPTSPNYRRRLVCSADKEERALLKVPRHRRIVSS